MAPKIFLTGATGYIGGDALYALYAAHPEYDYTLLVRSQARADVVAKAFPGARLRFVFGELDSADVIAAAAAAADVVLHTGNSADDTPSARAIVKGIADGHTAAHPGVYIHISGSNILTTYDRDNNRYGQPPLDAETFDDYAGVERLVTGLPDHASHRDVDLVVLDAAAAHPDVLRSAIVSPPVIYGPGHGPGNRRSLQVPLLAEALLKLGYAPVTAGSGETVWDFVHVHDLSALLVRLVDAGLDPARRDGGFADAAAGKAPGSVFGRYAYYFANDGPQRWADVAAWLAAAAVQQGLVPPPAASAVKKLPYDKVMEAASIPGIAGTWGVNARGIAARARKLLGWTPTAPSIEAYAPEQVASEAKRLGLQAKY